MREIEVMGNRSQTTSRLKGACAALVVASLSPACPAAAEPLPAGFVYLRDVDPTIVQEMRYAGAGNFVGRAVDGYEAGECILLKAAAEGLKRAQALLKAKGLSLKVYDCYRPARAVADFGRWVRDGDQTTKAAHYPRLDKSKLIGLGWIARVSGHSRGGSVDLTIVPFGASPQPLGGSGRSCTAPFDKADAPSGLDFGTSFDCFDELSATRHPAIKGEAASNRARLVAIMRQTGFANYAKEWWHFHHVASGEPPVQDFPVRPPGSR
jgi:D-alanyl-D-alanine dipeptidase